MRALDADFLGGKVGCRHLSGLAKLSLVMQTVNMHQAKTNLSKLVERAARGEQIIIANAGKPVAKLIAYHEDHGPRKPGFWKGRISIAADFDRLPADLSKAFKGETP